MAKVNFKRYETNVQAEASDFIDGNFIVTKEGQIYVDYDDNRKSLVNYNVNLIAISANAPATCLTGDKYYNTTNNKIYTAVATNTWGDTGEEAIKGITYVLFNDQSTYAYNGITLIKVGGVSGGVTNNYSTSTTESYSCNYINGVVGDVDTKADNIDIKVDRNSTYSTTEETICGTYNGSTLYRKVINIGNLPNASYADTATGLTNVTIINIYGRAVGGTLGNTLTIPYVGTGVESNISLSYYLPTNSIRIQVGTDRSGFIGYVTLEYIKNTSS